MDDPRRVLIRAAGHAGANAPSRMTVGGNTFNVSRDGLGIKSRNVKGCLRCRDYADEMGRKPVKTES